MCEWVRRWSDPLKLCRGSIAGQPTLGARRESLYVPVVEWKKVFWSGGMVQNGTGVEVRVCVCVCVCVCACVCVCLSVLLHTSTE